jgi:hypothetical protein
MFELVRFPVVPGPDPGGGTRPASATPLERTPAAARCSTRWEQDDPTRSPSPGWRRAKRVRKEATVPKAPQVQVPPIPRGSEVKIRVPGNGERGTWKVIGQVANSGLDDPAYDVVHTGNGRSRIFRGSRLIVLRPGGDRAGAA